MLRTFSEDNAVPKHEGEKPRHPWALDVVVRVGNEDLGKELRRGDHDAVHAPKCSESNEAIVGCVIDPFTSFVDVRCNEDVTRFAGKEATAL